MSESQSKISDDGKQWEASFSLAAPGVYDPELQLNSHQIVTMKQLFLDRARGGDMLQNIVITELITDIQVKEELELQKEEGGNPFVDNETLELLKNPKVVELMGRAASLAGNWQQDLMEAICLPGDEWPEDMTPPATFAEPLKRAIVAEHIKGLISANPGIDFSEQLIQLEAITGQIYEANAEPGNG